jgi:hypothetical protein
MSRCTTRLFLALALIACASTSSFAGYLATDASAYFDGVKLWSGTTPYSDGGNLVGTIDWAVYAPGMHPAAFTSYAPGAPNSVEALYTYQIFEAGTDNLSLLSVGISGEGNNAGSFESTTTSPTITGLAPSSASVTDFVSATWNFTGIGAGASSRGLFFTSPNTPINSVGVVLNGGSAAGAFPIPGSSPFLIPEPTTLVLAFSGLVGLALVTLRRRIRGR